MFLTFDGIDGTGKSTQLDLLCGWLTDQGYEVARCRDPGTTDLGERLRGIVVEGSETPIAPQSETLIYMAARAQLVGEFILPALAAGQIVVADRFLLATVAYQAYGFGLPVEDIWSIGTFATQGITPTQTFLLDLDVRTAASRRGDQPDRMEGRETAYHERVRQGFLAEARRHAGQITVIDASRPVHEIHLEIQEITQKLIEQPPTV